jgi:hypothetical protein
MANEREKKETKHRFGKKIKQTKQNITMICVAVAFSNNKKKKQRKMSSTDNSNKKPPTDSIFASVRSGAYWTQLTPMAQELYRHATGDLAKPFVAGLAGGVVGALAGYPLDTSKTRQQSSATRVSVFTVLKANWAEGGVRALFKGSAAPVLSQTVFASLHFGVYDWMRVKLLRVPLFAPARRDTPRSVAVAGAAAGAAILPFNVPFEIVKIRAQMDNVGARKFRTSLDVVSDVLQRHGVRGLFRGSQIQFFREIGYGAVYFATYLSLVQQFRLRFRDYSLAHVLAVPAAGGVAGALAWLAVFPIDSVKTRIQIRDDKVTARRVAMQILRQGGVSGFFQGCAACMFRALVVHALRFSCFELVLTGLGDKRHHL